MRDDHKQELMTANYFGKKVKDFLQTEVGILLMARAKADKAKAIQRMSNVDPANAEAVRSIQSDLAIPEKVVAWLHEAIENGRIAHDTLTLNEGEEASY